MKSKEIIIIIFITVFVIGGGIYLLISHKGASPAGSGDNTVSSGSVEATSPTVQTLNNTVTSTMLSLGTSNGTVQVNNFYLSNPSITDGGETIVLANRADYIITYDRIDSSFWIGIDPSKFTTTRLIAEEDFISTLGINKTDACKLSVSEGTFYSSTSTLGGQSFPLTFCGTSPLGK